MSIVANPGYVLAQLEKALVTAAGGPDAATRERARRKVERFRQALEGMLGGSIEVGSRTPVADTPAWATLDVAHGGFATGQLLAGGPLQPHEAALLRDVPAPPGKERAALNLHFLSDAGRADLLRRLASGCYRVNVPEEAALLVVAWLIAHRLPDRAQAVLDAILPFVDRLRFYPVPDDQPLLPSAVVKLQPASEVAATLEATRPQAQVAAMNEALRVWAPLYDRAVSLFLETVEGETPHLRTDGSGALVRRPDGQPQVGGGWPCKRVPPGWAARASALLAEHAAARAEHGLCGKPEHSKGNHAILRRYLERCARDPASLDGRDVGTIRKVLASFVTKHGVPGDAKHRRLREEQARVAARPTHQQAARVLASRLSACPKDAGLPSLEPVLGPIAEAEAALLGAGARASVGAGTGAGAGAGAGASVVVGAPIPQAVARRLDRCLEAPIEELVTRGVIPSSEVLAIVLPQVTSQVRAAGLADPALARLYGAVYAAFRRRRSLLLLNLESQVRLEELPWVAALEEQRAGKLEERARASQALSQVAALAITSFPETIFPNKLLQEMRALVKGSDLQIPLVDELAADIFMGELSGKFLDAAKIAARLVRGTLYARYYDVPVDTVLRIDDVAKKRGFSAASSAELVALCTDRANVADFRSGSRTARNGKVIEQEQILTTHNLAAVFEALGLLEPLRGRLPELSRGCFRFICKKEQVRIEKWHAKLVRVKNSAYAWRQMVFYLSFVDASELESFLAWAEEHLRAQREGFRARFTPALRGLTIAAMGGDLDRAERAGTARRFLGWSTEKHWLLGGT